MKTKMNSFLRLRFIMVNCFFLFTGSAFAVDLNSDSETYKNLVTVFQELRLLEQPTGKNGVPDFSVARMKNVNQQLHEYQKRFSAIDTSGWMLEQKIDYELVRAEMNGLDFNIRVLKPWQRDPAYYVLLWTEQSDTPSHEGPVCHAAIELWEYAFPLSVDDEKKLAAQLKIIPLLLEQARINLTGNARDLWVNGINNIKIQASDLDDLAKKTEGSGNEFHTALTNAKNATISFGEWLEEKLPSKNGPSGIGKENYTWYLRHVLLVPLSWEEEVSLLQREIARAFASLELERHHNRNLPPLKAVSTPEEYNLLADQSVTHLMKFLKEQEILPVRDFMEPALRKHLGSFQAEEKRNFFSKMMHYDPLQLYTHATHWFDLARMNNDPHSSPIRRTALPYNIWVSRSEGLATGVEELFMHSGLYDNNPRSKELVWVMLAFRCARGLASLYVHANEISVQQAREYQVEWTPAEWKISDPKLIVFEQQLYLRQPGYGPSYVTGKYLVERLMKDRSRQVGENFQIMNFFDEMYGAGMIPVSLIRWQLTGMNDEIRDINKSK
ncbi:MAG: DUF885 family protein [Bacteroidota bacterium]|nr:DUF885 family protein [Bacteroidota bacterium]